MVDVEVKEFVALMVKGFPTSYKPFKTFLKLIERVDKLRFKEFFILLM